jgi:hypothetical protein
MSNADDAIGVTPRFWFDAQRVRFDHAPEGNAVVVCNLRVFRPEGADIDV